MLPPHEARKGGQYAVVAFEVLADLCFRIQKRDAAVQS